MDFGKLIFRFGIILLLLGSHSIRGQSNSPVADSIDKQFESVLETSNNFQDHKVIKIYKISDLRKETIQQINRLSEEIQSLNQENEQQTQALNRAEKELEETQADLIKAEKSKDEFVWLGMNIQKQTYQNVVFGIIIALVLILLILIFQYRKNKRDTLESRKNLDQLETEFDAYRKKALETQQKLGRQLQDERMKNKTDSGN